MDRSECSVRLARPQIEFASVCVVKVPLGVDKELQRSFGFEPDQIVAAAKEQLKKG